jgi:hypothetical protein
VHATALGGGLSHLIGACVLRLRATYATPGGATVAALGLAFTGAVMARTAVTALRLLRATGQQARRHAQTARIAGVHLPALGAVLLEHPQPAAYCMAGRQPTVVLTTGALIRTYDVPPYVNSADQSGAVPFLDLANQDVLAGAQYNPQVLAGLSAAQIASRLRDPSSPVAQAIDGSATSSSPRSTRSCGAHRAVRRKVRPPSLPADVDFRGGRSSPECQREPPAADLRRRPA